MANRRAITYGANAGVNIAAGQLVETAPGSQEYNLLPSGAAPTGPAGGDLTGTYPNPTLAAIVAASTQGDGENVPVVTIDAKGRVTGLSTTPVLGSRVLAVNKQGAPITKGQAVYVYSGGSQKLFVKLAKADSEATSHGILGLVADASIANNDPGYVRVLGVMNDLDTSTLTEGAPVYLSATVAGGLTSTAPVAPNHNTYIGVCTATHGTQGAIYVAPNAGYELSELHDVLISGVAAGDLLRYNGTVWANCPSSTLLAPYVLKAGDTMTGTLGMTGAATKLGVGTASPSAPLHITNYVTYRNTVVSQLQTCTAPGLVQENGAVGAADATALTTYLGKFSIYKRNAAGDFAASDLVWDVDSSGNVNVEKGNQTTGQVYLDRSGRIGIGTTSPQVPIDARGNVGYRGVGVVQLQVGTAPALMQENGALGANDFMVLSTYNGKLLVYKGNHSGSLVTADLKATLDSTGRLQLGGSAGLNYTVASTAILQLPAGSATASTAPLKFTSGTLNTAAEAGAVEFDGTSFFGSTSFRSAFVRGVKVDASLTPTVVAANSASVQTYTVTGLVVPHAVTVSPPSIDSGLGIMWARCSASDTLEICWRNFTAGDLTPASGTYRVAGVRV